jgi:beta-lactamase regulating signal transducer with metallopeptidase domain
MTRLDSWLSPGVLHALGWALIHALWQGLALAALAAMVMAASRRPSVRYGIAVGAIALMLAAPLATFFVLVKPVPVTDAGISMPAVPPMAFSAAPAAPGMGVALALEMPSRLAASDVLSPNTLPWLVGAWLLGVALFSLRLAGGFLLLERRRRKQSAALSPRIQAMCRELQRQLGLDRAIRYLACDWLQAPAVIGWIRPIVFLPISALTGLNEEQLRAVIAHELAHIRRLDAFVNLFQMLVETLLFYHPAIWWLNRRIRAERELCCDEIAVSLTGNRLEYARALTRMAEWEKAPILAMAANRGSLSERVFHVIEPEPFGAGQRMLGLTGSLLFLAAALISANVLLRNTYPIPAARAQVSIKAALASSQVAIDHAMQQVLQASEPAAMNARAKQANGDVANHETDMRAQSANNNPVEKLVVPSLDLLRAIPVETIPTPTLPALNNASNTTTGSNEQPATPAKANLNQAMKDDQAHHVDPEAVVCQTPELVTLSKDVGRQLCVQNAIMVHLAVAAPALKIAALSIIRYPTGYGQPADPNATTCRQHNNDLGTRLQSPLTCALNSYWTLQDQQRRRWNSHVPRTFEAGTP